MHAMQLLPFSCQPAAMLPCSCCWRMHLRATSAGHADACSGSSSSCHLSTRIHAVFLCLPPTPRSLHGC